MAGEEITCAILAATKTETETETKATCARCIPFAKLRRLKALWDAEDDERRRRRAAEIEMIVAADRIWLARQKEIEEQERKARSANR